MILEEHYLEPEDMAELGLISQPSEVDLDEDALEWIETAAYYYWLQEGCPDGKHLEHWDRAYQLYHDCRE